MTPDVDEVAVERACQGDRSIPLNAAEMAAALAALERRRLPVHQIAALLGTTPRTIGRWRTGQYTPARRPGKAAA